MAKCKNCKYLNTVQDVRWCACINDSPHEDIERDCKPYTPMTNADRIRSMTDEELITFLCYIESCDGCNECIAGKYCHTGHTGMIDWVKKECNERVVNAILNCGYQGKSEDEE